MMPFRIKFSTSLFVFFLFSFSLLAQKTQVMVRAKAKDAKFIGSSMGGAHILIKNAENDTLLAEGITTGSTGNTSKIMQEAHERGKTITNERTAGFLAKMDINTPVFVTIEALAPFNKKQARVLSSTQTWLLPGKDLTGEGIVLEIPGLVVDIFSPQTHEVMSAGEIEVKANVVMMCGCPITKGGVWDAGNYEVKAQFRKEGKLIKEVPLNIQEKASTFAAKTRLKSGNYEILVYSFDSKTGNTGVDKTNIVLK